MQDKLKRVSDLPPHLIDVLKSIRESYGYKADDLLGEEDADKRVTANRWASALAGYPQAAIREAWVRCRKSFPKQPPTLEQFEFMCRRVVDNEPPAGDDVSFIPTEVADQVIPPGGHPSHKPATEEIERRRAVKRSEPEVARKHLADIKQGLADIRLKKGI